MTALRRFLSHHRWLALSIVAAALLLRVLVPAGYMMARTAGGITIELCSGLAAPGPAMPLSAATMPGMHHGSEKPAGHARAEMPCAFATLAASSLAAADPLILTAAIAFVLAAVFRPGTARRVTRPLFLRPPLRGPPAIV